MKKKCLSLTVFESRNVKNYLDVYVVLSFFISFLLSTAILLLIIRYIARNIGKEQQKQDVSPVVRIPVDQQDSEDSDDDSAYGFDFDSDGSYVEEENVEKVLIKSEVSLQSEVPSANVIFEKQEQLKIQPPSSIYDDAELKMLYNSHADDILAKSSNASDTSGFPIYRFVHDMRIMRFHLLELIVKYISNSDPDSSYFENFLQFEVSLEEALLKPISQDHTSISRIIDEIKTEIPIEDKFEQFRRELHTLLSMAQVSVIKGLVTNLHTFLRKEIDAVLSLNYYSYVIQENLRSYRRHFTKLLNTVDVSSEVNENVVKKYTKSIAELLSKISDLMSEEMPRLHSEKRVLIHKLEASQCSELKLFLKEMEENKIEPASFQEFLIELLIKQQEERIEKGNMETSFVALTESFLKVWRTFQQTVFSVENEMLEELKTNGLTFDGKNKLTQIITAYRDENMESQYRDKLSKDRVFMTSFIDLTIRKVSSEFRLCKELASNFFDILPNLSMKRKENFINEMSNKFSFIVFDTVLAIITDFSFKNYKNSFDINAEFKNMISWIETRDSKITNKTTELFFIHESADTCTFSMKYFESIEKIFESNASKFLNDFAEEFMKEQLNFELSCYHDNMMKLSDCDLPVEQIKEHYDFFKRMNESKRNEIYESFNFADVLTKNSKFSTISKLENDVFDECVNIISQYPKFYGVQKLCMVTRFMKKIERYNDTAGSKSPDSKKSHSEKKLKKKRKKTKPLKQ